VTIGRQRPCKGVVQVLEQLLACSPIMPFITEEIWQALRNAPGWPAADAGQLAGRPAVPVMSGWRAWSW